VEVEFKPPPPAEVEALVAAATGAGDDGEAVAQGADGREERS
jgi:hypothetical protein